MTITLYGVYRSRASRNIWLLKELGQPFVHVPVIQADRATDAAQMTTRSPAFQAVNPNGMIPALDDDGLVLTESLAINLYLARKFGGPLAGQTLAEEGLIAQWTLWAATVAEPHTIQVLYHTTRNPYGPTEPAKAAAAVDALRKPMAVLEAHLATSRHLVGGRFTVADLNLAEVLRYARNATELFAGAPHVERWFTDAQARPAFRAMWAEREREPA
jgi:glutathione S-transferase